MHKCHLGAACKADKHTFPPTKEQLAHFLGAFNLALPDRRFSELYEFRACVHDGYHYLQNGVEGAGLVPAW